MRAISLFSGVGGVDTVSANAIECSGTREHVRGWVMERHQSKRWNGGVMDCAQSLDLLARCDCGGAADQKQYRVTTIVPELDHRSDVTVWAADEWKARTIAPVADGTVPRMTGQWVEFEVSEINA